jgi:protein-disulfide isomerase
MRSAAVALLALVLCAAASGANAPRGGPQVAALFAGIPQHGVELGRRTAPVTLVEFADLQCPYCARWERTVLPEIVRKYVRPGKVRLVFAGMTFLGPGSLRGLRTVLAAGLQDRLWNVAALVYLNQGTEGSGWLNDAFLRRAGALVPGLDVAKMLAARRSAAVEQQRRDAANLAESGGVDGTPSFAVGRTNKGIHLLPHAELTAKALEPAIDALLQG